MDTLSNVAMDRGLRPSAQSASNDEAALASILAGRSNAKYPDAVVLPLPVLSNCTVTFWHTATGATKSCTVTVAEQVAVLLLTSVTVNVTVFGLVAILAQVNAVWLKDKV